MKLQVTQLGKIISTALRKRDACPPLTAASPVLQSEPRTSTSQTGGSSAFADEEPRWSGSFWTFGAVDGLPVVWRFSLNLHASSDVVGQSLGCVSKFCLCILETPASWLLLAENCHLPPTWQFAGVIEHIELDKGLDMVDKAGIGGKNE